MVHVPMTGFCTECGNGLVSGSCPLGHLQAAHAMVATAQAIAGVHSALAIGRLPKAPVVGRLFGAAIEYFACITLLILGDVLGLVGGSVFTAPFLIGFLCLRDVAGGRLSVGKRIGSLRVVDVKTGQPATTSQGLGRNSYYIALAIGSFIPYLNFVVSALFGLLMTIDLLMVMTSPQGRRFGDHLAGTQVVVARS